MAAVKPAGKPGLEEDAAPIHRIRITLASRNTAALEKGARRLLSGCQHACLLGLAINILASLSSLLTRLRSSVMGVTFLQPCSKRLGA